MSSLHGRRARRLQRRQERALKPEVFELWAVAEDGREARHRSTLEAVRRVAAELRGEGYQIRWFPSEGKDFPRWNWRTPRSCNVATEIAA